MSGPQEEKAGLGHPGHSKRVESGDTPSQRESVKGFERREQHLGMLFILGLLANSSKVICICRDRSDCFTIEGLKSCKKYSTLFCKGYSK